MEYCDSCGSKFEIIYESDISYLKNDIFTGETIWTWFRRIPKRIWVSRYINFVENLNEENKKKFKEKITSLYIKYFICPNPNCMKKVEDRSWRSGDGIRTISWKSLR